MSSPRRCAVASVYSRRVPCYTPLKGWLSRTVSPTGRRAIVFNKKEGFEDRPAEVPCGQCVGCRLENSRQWAMRCYHEASLYMDNSFITLTYNQEHLPKDMSINLREFQLFMKRLRKQTGQRFRFLQCGEYGSKNRRPHYHACLFGLDFPDKRLHQERNGYALYTSETLSRIWGKGFVTVGAMNFLTAAYTARYCVNKVNGRQADVYYTWINYDTGEVFEVEPERASMSGGLGRRWFERYWRDVYPSDFVVIDNRPMLPPRYYDQLLERQDPDLYRMVKAARKRRSRDQAWNNTPERLAVREEVAEAKLQRMLRELE